MLLVQQILLDLLAFAEYVATKEDRLLKPVMTEIITAGMDAAQLAP